MEILEIGKSNEDNIIHDCQHGNLGYKEWRYQMEIGGNEWRLDIGDSREEGARQKQNIVSTGR